MFDSVPPSLPPAQADAVPVRGRIEAIDGLRGWFLALMTITHAPLWGGTWLKTFHPGTYSFVDSASGFVFMSGLVAGLVYSRVAHRSGWEVAAGRMRGRALHLYACTVGLILAIAAIAVIVPDAAHAWRPWVPPLMQPDLRVVGAVLLMLQQAPFVDILPMYALFLVLSPLILRQCMSGRTIPVLATSVLIWGAAQAGVAVTGIQILAKGLNSVRPDMGLPNVFNMAAWQLLFVGGLAIGAAMTQGRLKPQAIFRPQSTYLFWLSLVGIALVTLAVSGFGLHKGWLQPPGTMGSWLALYSDKVRFGLACVIDFAMVAYAATWLLVAGPQASNRGIRIAAAGFGTVVRLPFARLLGRHSLQVYAWQVVLVYALKVLNDHLGAYNMALDTAIMLGTIALLAAPALLRERLTRRRAATAVPQDRGQPESSPSSAATVGSG